MRALLLGTLVSLLSAFIPSQASLQTLPVFLWGSGDLFSLSDRQTGLHALYQVSSPEDLAADVLGTIRQQHTSGEGLLLNQTASQSSEHNLVTVFVLGELKRGDLNQEGKGVLAGLSKALKEASSSVYLSDLRSTQEQLVQTVKAHAQSMLEIGDCKAGIEGVALQNLRLALEGKPGQVSIVLCDSQISNLFGEVEEQLTAARRPFVIVYAGQPEQGSTRPMARTLMAAQSDATDLCDRKCRIQVRLFEVIILLVLLLVALGTALGMLHILDTPTRFEQEKKETNRHHD